MLPAARQTSPTLSMSSLGNELMKMSSTMRNLRAELKKGNEHNTQFVGIFLLIRHQQLRGRRIDRTDHRAAHRRETHERLSRP